ncbi:MAG: DUF120 domain-containing protein [Candidatus Methanogasteraceae archaeon]
MRCISKMEEIMFTEPLKRLALLGALRSGISISSAEFARHLKTSPQTASRKLQILEQENMITRRILPKGQEIMITEDGVLALQREYQEYQRVFGDYEDVRLTGAVCAGLGEGKYYIALDGYMRQFEQKLGFTPHPGTLNIELDSHSINMRKRLNAMDGIHIEGFEDGVRTFGSAKCFEVQIGDTCGAIVIPNRKHYPDDIIEIIAPVNLRERLRVGDGGDVEVVLCKT